MKKQSALLILSSLFLLASCSAAPAGSSASNAPSSSEPSSSASESVPSSEPDSELPSESSSEEPALTAEERFKQNFASYLEATKKAEALATSSTYVEGDKSYSASFYKEEAVQTNPNGLKTVRSIEGSIYREFRFQNETLSGFSSVELNAENAAEYREKTSFLFANNVYGLSGYLSSGALDGYLEGGEGYAYAFENGVFTLTSTIEDVSSCTLTLVDGAFVSLNAEGSSSFSYSYQKDGEKQPDPNPIKESDFYYTDFTPSLVSQNGKYYVGSSYTASFASSNPKASSLVDPISPLVSEDDEFVSYNKRTGEFKILKAGQFSIEFASAHGVSKTLNLTAEDQPIRSIRADQEGRDVHAGDTLKLTATVFPMSAAQAYSASLTSGAEFASLSGSSEEGFTLKVNDDAAAGNDITVTFLSEANTEEGIKASDSVTFHIVAKEAAPTGELAKKLIGSWQSQDVGYGVSDLVFASDGTGTLHYFASEDGYEAKFVFEWDASSENSIVKDGTFFQLDADSIPQDPTQSDYTFTSLVYADGVLSLELYNTAFWAEENMDFTKVQSAEPSLSEKLIGEWTSEDSYPASTLVLAADGKATVAFYSPVDSYETYFSFEWEVASGSISVKEGTFAELDGEGGNPLDEDSASYEFASLVYADGTLTLTVNNLLSASFGGEPEESLAFVKVAQPPAPKVAPVLPGPFLCQGNRFTCC